MDQRKLYYRNWLNFLSTAKHNKKSTEAEPAEFSRAPGRTARDLLFFNVQQNMINKMTIETVCCNLQKEPQRLAYTNRVRVALAKSREIL